MNKRHQEEIHPGEAAVFGRGKTHIEVLEPSSRSFEPSLPVEENLKRLNEALQELEPVAVEVVKLPVNTGRTDTGAIETDVPADVNAVEAETAGAVERQRAIQGARDRDTGGGAANDDKLGAKPGVDSVTRFGTRVNDDDLSDDDVSEEKFKIKDKTDDDDITEEKIKVKDNSEK